MMKEPHDLVVDIGNTRTKLGLFSLGRMVRHGAMEHGDLGALAAFLGDLRLAGTVIGQVGAGNEKVRSVLQGMAPVLEVDGSTPLPIASAYGTPMTLGVDRLANAVGAKRHFPDRAVLVIDMGSCITCDVVERDGTYAGGAISPGVHMRARAMNAYSARLPLVYLGDPPSILGTDTERSLQAGLFHGVLGELKEYIRAYGHERPAMAVTLTGGDAPRFIGALKSGIFAHPLLTLEGLHAILVHNRDNGGIAHRHSGFRP
ncbi:MAG: type III pantothenate kinase [Flavobacteriales bacterium]|nr:type III pantothenate kinase [Flavobacteriales bacterium]